MDFKFQISNFELKTANHGSLKRKASNFFFCIAAVTCAAVFAPFAAAQKSLPIAAIQGDQNQSPHAGETVSTRGIVTARVKNGFYIQTPDAETDKNPNTSEGVFVFSQSEPPSDAAIGNMVSIAGNVVEFVPRNAPLSLPLTQIALQKGSIKIESTANPLPAPVKLSSEDFRANVSAQLEKYEGMRVHVARMTVSAPTKGRDGASDGTFYGTLAGLRRPFREPGIDEAGAEAYDYFFSKEKTRGKLGKDFPDISFFDNNPERLRVETAAQLGAAPLDVTTFADIRNLTGVLSYAYRCYSILADANGKPTVSNIVKAAPLPAPREKREFSIAGLNIENFFDDEDDPAIKEDIVETADFERKMKKISLAVRINMQTPDVVGIVEVENQAVLKKLADRINADSTAAGKPNPQYEAVSIEGNDGRGIDVGFLVKKARVKVLEIKQFGKDEKFLNPVSKQEVVLNDRPPLLVRLAVSRDKRNAPVEFTVIANHLKSFNGYSDEKDAPAVRMKKKLQAEYLARLVAMRMKANPSERIALVGDFNAFQFNDGIVDMIGTIKGKPAAKETVLNPSPDLIDGELTDLVDLIDPAERYSYSFDGNAQVLDHIIVNDQLKRHFAKFVYARINADFPEVYRRDETRVERFSDHDAAVAYFTFKEK